MQFFEGQETAKKNTWILFVYFFLAILLMIAAIDAVIVAVLYYGQIYQAAADNHTQYIQYTPAQSWFMIKNLIYHTSVFIVPAVVSVIFIGMLIRQFQIRAGGISVAELAGARKVEENTTDSLERRFMNIVEEMAIASGEKRPLLYIMDQEPGINAFVAGIKPEDTVMVVTRGALEGLSRDELQGVIGHEYSHIAHKDMIINLRLIALLGGILAIGQTAIFILRTMPFRSSSNDNKRGNGTMVIIVGAIAALVIGYIGLFFGRLIKAAISRQRETLADAASVQYTRNPQGLVLALKRIQQSEEGTLLKTRHSEDISHLCFCPPLEMMFSDLLASHPPIEKRIQMLDPAGVYASVELGVIDKNEKIEKKEKNKKRTSGDEVQF